MRSLHTWQFSVVVRPLVVVALLAGMSGTASAQAAARTLRGEVVDATTGAPLPAAHLTLQSVGSTLSAGTTDSGTFAFVPIPARQYNLNVRRLGYAPFDTTINLVRDTTIVIRLRATAVGLDAVHVGAGPGIYGVVGAVPRLSPIAGATVDVVGATGRGTTDSVGLFALSIAKPGQYLVRISRPGFIARTQWTDVGGKYYTEVTALLDSGGVTHPDDAGLWEDFGQRAKWRAMASALVPGDELRRYGSGSMSVSLETSPAFGRSGLRIGPSTCVFINGRPEPDWPLDAFDVKNVEAVELYGPTGDPTNTLFHSWPPGRKCGRAETLAPMLSHDPKSVAAYAVIWLRSP